MLFRVSRIALADLFSDFSGQILCCTQALAAWASLGTIRPARAVIAGYSIGELAAWGCTGALNEVSILRLAQRGFTVARKHDWRHCAQAHLPVYHRLCELQHA